MDDMDDTVNLSPQQKRQADDETLVLADGESLPDMAAPAGQTNAWLAGFFRRFVRALLRAMAPPWPV
jgi:hypothetical protein